MTINRKIDPRKWARKWLKDDGGLPPPYIERDDRYWDNIPPCYKCNSKYGEMFKKSDGHYYCKSCESIILGEIIRVRTVTDVNNRKTNLERKVAGLEIDDELELVPCDKCGRLTFYLKLLPMDRGNGLEVFYHCQDCLLGKTNENK